MQKIPTLFVRDPTDRRRLTRTVHRDCQWVLDGEGVATRKFDGKCVVLDESGDWWARVEVHPGMEAPPHFCAVFTDPVTGIQVGATPIAASPFARAFEEALSRQSGPLAPGSYELYGELVKGNPEGVTGHYLQSHADAPLLDNSVRSYDALRDYLAGLPYEGIVWLHPDGRRAKIKRVDIMDAAPVAAASA